jgi:hypothetical protein
MSSSNLAVGRGLFAITPHNSTNFAKRARAVYVGVGGDIAFVDELNNAVILKNVPQGAVVPMECTRINAAGTTATDLVGFV